MIRRGRASCVSDCQVVNEYRNDLKTHLGDGNEVMISGGSHLLRDGGPPIDLMDTTGSGTLSNVKGCRARSS
jgi:hypothetical protein